MSEPIDWLDDGTPYSPRFKDRYRSESGGLAQARQVFLQGCGLPAGWAGLPQWRILETGFGLGLNFLVTWQAWKSDADRPRLLHFVSTEAYPASAADLLLAAAAHPELQPLAAQLAAQFRGLLPGFHRLAFEGGRVLLTLCVGDAKAMLREQAFEADAVYLDGFSPQCNPDLWDLHTLKAVARCCRRGTRLATWTVARSVIDHLKACGFVVQKTPGMAPKRDNLQAAFNPRWEPLKARRSASLLKQPASTCVVVGAGLAGAACAASLARRGWQVLVLDALAGAALGASGLPAGLLAPHVSPDDGLLSRLSRSGVRATLLQAASLLKEGTDWQASGVLQRRFDESGSRLPPAWPEAGKDWSLAATPAQLEALAPALGSAGPPAPVPAALWHAAAGWIRPGKLVAALLGQPGIEQRYGVQVARLERIGAENQSGWRLLDAAGDTLAEADLVVLAAGHACAALLQQASASGRSAPEWPLQAVRGQVAWGRRPAGSLPLNGAAASGRPLATFPPFPVNGHGSFIPAFGAPGESCWMMGATFERDQDSTECKQADQLAVFERLQMLLPQTADALQPAFERNEVQSWAGVRCALPDHLPALGAVDPLALPGLLVCTALGSRGLSFAVLCGELLAAVLHAEPLPVEKRLAQALMAQRSFKARVKPL